MLLPRIFCLFLNFDQTVLTLAICSWMLGGIGSTANSEDLVIDAGQLTSNQNNPVANQNARSVLWHWASISKDTASSFDSKTPDTKSRRFDMKEDSTSLTVKGNTSSMMSKRGADADYEAYYETKPSIRAVHLSCYSCMSSEFEKYWPHLRTIYNQPKNFTDLCLDLPRRSRIGTQQCDSACLTVLERRYSGGRPSGYNVIRGCLSSVYKPYVGASSKLISLRRKTATSRRSICEDMDARDLLPPAPKSTVDGERTGPTGSRSANPLFRASLCTCYGELCNNQPLSGASAVHSRRSMFSACSFYMTLYVLVKVLRAQSYR